MNNLILRTKELSSAFSYNERVVLSESNIEMIPVSFLQQRGREEIDVVQSTFPSADFCTMMDNGITENKSFKYIIFAPVGREKSDKAILLLHGLNERTWDKYLIWAEELCKRSGNPVILFPMSFHINRTPCSWFSPRWIMPWASKRKEENSGLKNSSFFNLALSSRLTKCPERFYISGKESVFNICQLFWDIRSGKNPLFSPETSIDIFAYSIGAFLSQVLLISNQDNLFSDCKLFAFCGGSIFEDMNGNAKEIMDEKAFNTLRDYYLNDFSAKDEDLLGNSFDMMISSEKKRLQRESFFERAKERIKMVTMKKDTVIPTFGARNAVGRGNAQMVEELDFPFQYSHQIPFPTNGSVSNELLCRSFGVIFDKAAAFLCA